MTPTPDLIDLLSHNLRPVRRWRPPLLRAAGWTLLAAIVLVGLIVGQGLRPDFSSALSRPGFVVSLGASVLTATLAIYAAFVVCVPGRSSLWCLLPLPAVLLWISVIGYQCLTDWVRMGPDGFHLGEAARCMATIVLVSVPLGLALAMALRRSSLFRPRLPVLLGSLAIAGMTSAALALLHPLDASVMILMLNVGVGTVIVGAGAMLGHLNRRGR